MVYLISMCTSDLVALRAFVRPERRKLTVLDAVIPGDTFLAYLAALTMPDRSETQKTRRKSGKESACRFVNCTVAKKADNPGYLAGGSRFGWG